MSYLLFFFLFFFLWTHPTESISPFIKLPLLHTSTLHHRHHHHHRSHGAGVKAPIKSGASSGTGQYFVTILLGSPPQALFLVADTGSDLVWVKSSPCKANCSLHHPPSSAFFPRLSSSFRAIHCFDSLCQLVPHPTTQPHCPLSPLHSPCFYSYSYTDGSITSGIFSLDTFSFNSTRKRVAFGCSYNVSGPSLTGPSFNGAQGVLGLGRESISFPSQLGPFFGNTFSYCLMDYTLSPPPTSYLVIGEEDDDVISRKGFLKFTPLITNPRFATFYYVGIKNVYVNGVKLRIPSSVWSIDESGGGGTVIDSGTTLTFFIEPAYSHILGAFKKRLSKVPKPVQPFGFDLCLNVTAYGKRLVLPRMRFEMDGGAVFSPPPSNYFIETDDGVKCLAVRPVGTDGGSSVFGNLIQQGFLLVFERDRSRLGFSRRGCGSP